MSVDLHRHDEFSTFDGFGKARDLARLAKELGYEALGLSNHGNTSGMVEHYFACKETGIKPILGVETYFLPVFKERRDTSHLCLFATSLKGYKNINKIITKANKSQFYYKAVVDFALLEKYSEDIICTSACIAGLIASSLVDNNYKRAEKVANKFKSIFGDNFYIEIQPYKLTTEGVQETANVRLAELARKLDIKCILTSDSHFGKREEFDTYLKLHEVGGHAEFGAQYEERYMPKKGDLRKRFLDMHGDFTKEYFINKPKKFSKLCMENLQEIVDKVDDEILEKLELKLPTFNKDEDGGKVLWSHIKAGLKAKGKYTKDYVARCKEEFEVISYHGFEDYFLIVEDYVKYAKSKEIAIGPGRGSVCNCLIAYALDITDTDSIYFKLDFRRFLRKDKKKLPDIDIDFETDRRAEVIDYLIDKYKGKSARIDSYGLYKIDNSLNDLFKVCGVEDPEAKKAIKTFVNKYIDWESKEFEHETAMMDRDYKRINKEYDNIILHFSRFYKKLKYFGTHAAGVAITGGNIVSYTAIKKKGDKFTTSYDLNNLEQINAIKFDMLGLRTMSILKELRDLTGETFNYSWLDDEALYPLFDQGETDGIFQFEAGGAKSVLKLIGVDCAEDVVAGSALNRPGPLSLGMPQQYADNKQLVKDGLHTEKSEGNIFYEYAKETYGTFVYQEQIMKVCIELGGMSWADADKTIKFLKGTNLTEKALQIKEQEEAYLKETFVTGAKTKGLDEKTALEVFDKILVYSFNKGHAAGYALISLEQMYHKVHNTLEFWFVTLKYANEKDMIKLSRQAVKDGIVIFLPHVNYSSEYSILNIGGDKVICKGFAEIKNVGGKASSLIEEERIANGDFKDLDDFMARIEPNRRVINKRVLEALHDAGALVFDEEVYYNRVAKYNKSLY